MLLPIPIPIPIPQPNPIDPSLLPTYTLFPVLLLIIILNLLQISLLRHLPTTPSLSSLSSRALLRRLLVLLKLILRHFLVVLILRHLLVVIVAGLDFRLAVVGFVRRGGGFALLGCWFWGEVLVGIGCRSKGGIRLTWCSGLGLGLFVLFFFVFLLYVGAELRLFVSANVRMLAVALRDSSASLPYCHCQPSPAASQSAVEVLSEERRNRLVLCDQRAAFIASMRRRYRGGAVIERGFCVTSG